jgi:hypothetical protein
VFLAVVSFWKVPGSVLIPMVNAFALLIPETARVLLYAVSAAAEVFSELLMLIISTSLPTSRSCGTSV